MKKLLLAAVAASVAATGFAGTASYAAPSAQPAGFAANAYVEGTLGYARTNYVNAGFSTLTTADNHGNGGFAGGIDAGYNFMPHLGIEAGFMMPFENAQGVLTVGAKSENVKFKEYSFYGAARIDANVGDDFNVFLLGGVGYTHAKEDTSGESSHSFGFVGGFGADYAVADGFTVGANTTLRR